MRTRTQGRLEEKVVSSQESSQKEFIKLLPFFLLSALTSVKSSVTSSMLYHANKNFLLKNSAIYTVKINIRYYQPETQNPADRGSLEDKMVSGKGGAA